MTRSFTVSVGSDIGVAVALFSCAPTKIRNKKTADIKNIAVLPIIFLKNIFWFLFFSIAYILQQKSFFGKGFLENYFIVKTPLLPALQPSIK